VREDAIATLGLPAILTRVPTYRRLRCRPQCPNLEKLYLSNNGIKSTEGFAAGFPALTALCLFRNSLVDLETAIGPLKRLHKLREVDLDGNPCAQRRGYKYHVVRAPPPPDSPPRALSTRSTRVRPERAAAAAASQLSPLHAPPQSSISVRSATATAATATATTTASATTSATASASATTARRSAPCPACCSSTATP
jgi:hypothetical protein